MIYFAYGSNLCLPRLRSRVPGVSLIGPASLAGYELRWHKRSNDGSGKLSIVATGDVGAVVHGALFAVPEAEKKYLDQAEGLGYGYVGATVVVETTTGAVAARTYVAAPSYVDDALRPYTWYRDPATSGAHALGLPEAHVRALSLIAAVEDPDPGRERSERAFLPCSNCPQEGFLRAEFHRLTVLAALQRSSTYAETVNDEDRRAFREALIVELDGIAVSYTTPVSDEAHCRALGVFSNNISAQHAGVLACGRFRLGLAQKAVNLFLKYLWSAGWIPMPPHCPFDSVIMRLLPASQRLSWTKLDDMEAYRHLVACARRAAAGKPLAFWEMEAYEQLRNGPS